MTSGNFAVADLIDFFSWTLVLPLLLFVAYRAGLRRGGVDADVEADRQVRQAVKDLVVDPAVGTLVWRRVVANQIQAGALDPRALVTSDVQVWHRLDELDQQLVLGVVRATTDVLLVCVSSSRAIDRGGPRVDARGDRLEDRS